MCIWRLHHVGIFSSLNMLIHPDQLHPGTFEFRIPSVIFVSKVQANHYSDVIMSTITSLITSRTIVYSTVYADADQRKHQSPASLSFVRGIHRRPVNSPHKWPVTRKMFPFDDVIMTFMGMHFYILGCHTMGKMHRKGREDMLTTFEIQTWLSGFIMAIQAFRIF